MKFLLIEFLKTKIIKISDEGFILEANGFDVDAYTFNTEGKFIICVIAYDELGNSSSAYYNVVVTCDDALVS